RDDRRDRVVEIELIATEERSQALVERGRREGSARDDRRPGGELGHFFANDLDSRERLDPAGELRREELAIDRQSRSGRDARELGDLHDERAESPHLLLEEPDRGVEGGAPKRVRADELAEPIALMRLGPADRPHLEETDA